MDKIYDLTFLKTFTQGDKSRMAKYINMFISGAPTLMEHLKQQIEANEWPLVRTTAHSLKTQLKYMGVESGYDLSALIEKKSEAQSEIELIPELCFQLESIIATACGELKKESDKL